MLAILLLVASMTAAGAALIGWASGLSAWAILLCHIGGGVAGILGTAVIITVVRSLGDRGGRPGPLPMPEHS